MSRYLLIKDDVIENAIVIGEHGFTRTFIKHANGTKFPTKAIGGEIVLSPESFLVPDGYNLVESDKGNPGDAWPLVEPEPEEDNPE